MFSIATFAISAIQYIARLRICQLSQIFTTQRFLTSAVGSYRKSAIKLSPYAKETFQEVNK